MKKASAKLRRKIKIKFCRELDKMNSKFASQKRHTTGSKFKKTSS